MNLTDLLTNPAGVVGDFFAIMALELVKGIATGIADWVILPVWHFNERAVDYYTNQILLKPKQHQYAMPATAAFWGLGYALLFTDPDSGNLKPAPVRNSRLARHVRALQGIPARRALVKPKDVAEKTPKKPTPIQSVAPVKVTGTMSTSRATPVKVTGTHADQRNRTETPVDRAGEIDSAKAERSQETADAAHREPDKGNRTGDSSHAHSGGDSEGHKGTGVGGGNRT
jgi:hypothetical protein